MYNLVSGRISDILRTDIRYPDRYPVSGYTSNSASGPAAYPISCPAQEPRGHFYLAKDPDPDPPDGLPARGRRVSSVFFHYQNIYDTLSLSLSLSLSLEDKFK